VSLPHPAQPGLLTFSIFANEGALLEEATRSLAATYGEPLAPPCVYPFSHTPYYEAEMGAGLEKRLVIFQAPFPREGLARAKIIGFELEKKWSRDGKGLERRVNLDPGFLAMEQFLLLTFKPRAHKVYLEAGVWADLQLLYRKETRRYEGLPWTFKDYLGEEVSRALTRGREHLHAALARLDLLHDPRL